MTIVVIEDQIMMRGLIVRVCRDHFGEVTLGEAANGAEGVKLCRELQPNLVLLDLDLPDGDGLDRVAEIRKLSSTVKVIVVTSHSDEYAIYRSLEANVSGFVDKCAQPIEAVEEAIAAVAAGRTFYSPVVARVRLRMREDPDAFSKTLSVREQEVLRLLGGGLSNEEAAALLNITAGAIHSHRRNIMATLRIHSTPELIRYSIAKGFTRPRALDR